MLKSLAERTCSLQQPSQRDLRREASPTAWKTIPAEHRPQRKASHLPSASRKRNTASKSHTAHTPPAEADPGHDYLPKTMLVGPESFPGCIFNFGIFSRVLCPLWVVSFFPIYVTLEWGMGETYMKNTPQATLQSNDHLARAFMCKSSP